jgi:hypothetical protein
VVDGAAKDFVLAHDQTLSNFIRAFGYSFYQTLFVSNGGRVLVSQYYTGARNGAWGYNMDMMNHTSAEPLTGLYTVCSADRVPDWATYENGYTVKEAQLVGYVRCHFTFPEPVFSWWPEIVKEALDSFVGFQIDVGGSNFTRIAIFRYSIPVQMISANQPTTATIYRKWDYDYVSPPAGLAANLLGAQNWLPYEGRITQVADMVDGAQDLYRKYNVTGSLPPHSAMGALPKRIQYDITRGRKTIDLGAPARTDFGTLASRFRRSPKDNIIYI